MPQKNPIESIVEIPVIIRIVGDPKLAAKVIFNGDIDPKTGDYKVPKSIMVEDMVECRLKEYVYRNEVKAPQDLLIVFGIIGNDQKSLVISKFLSDRLSGLKQTSIVINDKELPIVSSLIKKSLEEFEVKNTT